ncbi:hypothetical protein M405DRAFT_211162 [Rhizopogon salebrosus TDB-379]|nr:hypothetical protein M405DRAFT_211162 [Rhizopogon salebrosus TDB-379]
MTSGLPRRLLGEGACGGENGLVHLEMLKKHYKELEKVYEVCMHFFCSSRKLQRTRWRAKCTPAVSKKVRSMWVWRRKAAGIRGRNKPRVRPSTTSSTHHFQQVVP